MYFHASCASSYSTRTPLTVRLQKGKESTFLFTEASLQFTAFSLPWFHTIAGDQSTLRAILLSHGKVAGGGGGCGGSGD
jgi:hypothetical protein